MRAKYAIASIHRQSRRTLPLPGVLPRIHIYYLLFFIYYLLY